MKLFYLYVFLFLEVVMFCIFSCHHLAIMDVTVGILLTNVFDRCLRRPSGQVNQSLESFFVKQRFSYKLRDNLCSKHITWLNRRHASWLIWRLVDFQHNLVRAAGWRLASNWPTCGSENLAAGQWWGHQKGAGRSQPGQRGHGECAVESWCGSQQWGNVFALVSLRRSKVVLMQPVANLPTLWINKK